MNCLPRHTARVEGSALGPTCPVELRELAAEHGYRHAWDESYDPRNVPHDKRDSWYVQVRGRYGDIWPHSPSQGLLAVFATRKVGARILDAVDGADLYADGDDGRTITFPVRQFAGVAALIRCHKKRGCHLSPEQLAEGGRRLAEYRRRCKA
jgi:hypothetical protein